MLSINSSRIGGILGNPPGFSAPGRPESNPYRTYYGLEQKQIPVESTDNFQATTRTLEEMYGKKSEYLGNSIFFAGATGGDWLLDLLPLKKVNDLQSNFTEWYYPVTLPPLVPEGGPVRLLTSEKKSGSYALIRRGLGFKINDSIVAKPEGAEFYAYHLEQLTLSFMEALKEEALTAITTSSDPELKRLESVSILSKDQYSNMVASILEREVRMWGILQQQPNGWAQMNTYVNIEHGKLNTNTSLDTYITGIQSQTFLTTLARDQTEASLFGPNAQSNVSSGVQYVSTDPFGNTVYRAKPILSVSNGQVNLLNSTVMIGEFWRCTRTDVPASLYDSTYRTQQFWSEPADGFVPLTLEDKIRWCYRFDKAGRLKNIHDLPHFSNLKGVPEEELAKDFLHKYDGVKAVPLSYFGQIRPEHYPLKTYSDMSATFFSQLSRSTTLSQSRVALAIKNLTQVIRAANNVPFDANYRGFVKAIADNLGDPVGHASENSDGTLNDVVCNSYGSVSLNREMYDIPKNPELSLFGWVSTRDPPANPVVYGPETVDGGGDVVATAQNRFNFDFPPLYGNYGGLKTILEQAQLFERLGLINARWVEVIRENLPIFDEFVEQLETTFPGCPFLSPKMAHPSIPNPTPQHVIFDNLIMAQFPYRHAFLRPTIATSLHAPVAAALPYESTFPIIAQLRQAMMTRYIGAYDIPADFIGADMRNYGGANTAYVRRQANGNNLPRGPYAGAFANIDHAVEFTLASPSSTNSNNIKRATKLHAYLLFAIVSLQPPTVAIPTPGDELIAAVQDPPVGLPALTGYVNAAATATVERVRTVRENILRYIANNPGRFRPSPEDARRFFAEIDQNVDNAVTSNNVLNENANAGDRRVDSRGTQLGKYKRTPFVIGAPAIKLLATHQWMNAAPAQILPPITFSSFKNPRTIADQDEFMAASDPNAPNRIRRAGSIFMDDYNQNDEGLLNPDNLTLVALAKSRGHVDQPPRAPDANPALGRRRSRKNQRTLRSYDAMEEPQFVEFPRKEVVAYEAPDSKTTGEIIDATFKDNFKEIMLYYGDRPTDLVTILAYMFTPITKYNLDRIVERNILFPWDFICARPYMQWTAEDCYATIGNGTLGNTLVGPMLTELGHDADTQSHTFSLHMWTGARIVRPTELFKVPNVCITGYIGGGADQPIEPEYHSPLQGQYGRNKSSSLMIIPIPLTEKILTPAISTTGSVDFVDRYGAVVASDVRVRISGYSTAMFQNALYDLTGDDWNNPINNKQRFISGTKSYIKDTPPPNSICFKSRALYKSTATNGFTAASSQTGHWHNHFVVSGAAKARIAQAAPPQSVTFTQNVVF